MGGKKRLEDLAMTPFLAAAAAASLSYFVIINTRLDESNIIAY